MFKKKKPVKLCAYSNDKALVDYFKIAKANRKLPDWFKKLSNNVSPYTGLNMTGCAGFLDLYAKAFTVPLWSDIDVEIGRIGELQSQAIQHNLKANSSSHPQSQRGDLWPDEHFQHMKFNSPWVVTCDEEVQFLLIGNQYENKIPHRVQLAFGLVEFKYQHDLNANFIFKREEKRYHETLQMGDPFMLMIPLTDRPVVIEHKYVDPDEFLRVASEGRFSFGNHNYLKERKIKREVDAEKSKCPFGFGRK